MEVPSASRGLMRSAKVGNGPGHSGHSGHDEHDAAPSGAREADSLRPCPRCRLEASCAIRNSPRVLTFDESFTVDGVKNGSRSSSVCLNRLAVLSPLTKNGLSSCVSVDVTQQQPSQPLHVQSCVGLTRTSHDEDLRRFKIQIRPGTCLAAEQAR